MEKAKLKPCPFCGNTEFYAKWRGSIGYEKDIVTGEKAKQDRRCISAVIGCEKCGMYIRDKNHTNFTEPEAAVAKWNTRRG